MDRSVEKLLLAAQDTGIANAARAWQLKNDSAAGTAEELNARMAEALSVMRDAAEKGLDPNLRSVSRLTGGNLVLRFLQPCGMGRCKLFNLALRHPQRRPYQYTSLPRHLQHHCAAAGANDLIYQCPPPFLFAV